MEICSYQNKRLFKERNIPVLKGCIAYTVEEALRFARKSKTSSWRIFPQLPQGELPVFSDCEFSSKNTYDSLENLSNALQALFSSCVQTASSKLLQPIQRVYIEEVVPFHDEFSASIRIDTETQQIIFFVSHKTSEKHFKLTSLKPNFLFWRKISKFFSTSTSHHSRLVDLLKAMFSLFVEYNAIAVEFNSIILSKNSLFVADGKIVFDDEALFHFPEIEKLREHSSSMIQQEKARQYNFRYTPFDGNIACLVNGSGLGSATLDLLLEKGGKPACLLDVGTEPTKESVVQALKLALSEPKVEGVFVNIFGGITRCDIIAEGIISASQEISSGLPLVVRMDGTNASVGTRLLFDSLLPLQVIQNFGDAVDLIVQHVEEGL